MVRNGRIARMAGAALLGGCLAVACAAAPAAAQADCLPPGEKVTALPWAQRQLAPERAWPLSTGVGQRVAVVSTGIGSSPYLSGTVAASARFAPPEPYGRDSGRPDCLGLGTAVAGIIAAQPRQGVGFHGVAPDARLLAAKVVGDRFPVDRFPRESVAPGVLADAIEWAVEQDATVIVVATITYEGSRRLSRAVRRALAADIVVVAAVGEPTSNEPPGTEPYPAAYEGVIGVGALAPPGTADVSRPVHVDLVAPGVDVLSTYPGDGLGPAHGSGVAAAYVGAAAALVRAYRPELSAEEVAHRLYATAAPAPEGTGSPRYGYGVVDPYHAVADRVTDGEPEPLPAVSPLVIPDEVLARQAAEARSDALAAKLTAASVAVAVGLAAMAFMGPRGRKRRWRAGLPPRAARSAEDERPEPPVTLFDDLKPTRSGG